MQVAEAGSTLRIWRARSVLPCDSSSFSSSWSESKWSSIARLEAPVMNTSRCAPAARASSTAYWISGLSTTGSISLGLALVAGRKRVPRPATGNTAVLSSGFRRGSIAPRGIDLSLQQIAQAGARGRPLRTVILPRLRLVVNFLGLDRQRNRTRLAIHAHELRLDLVADLQDLAGVLDAIAPEFGGAQLAFDAIAQIDDGAARVDFAHCAAHDAALRIVGDVTGERILRQLLDAQRDACPFRIHRQHHRVDLLALLVSSHTPSDVP